MPDRSLRIIHALHDYLPHSQAGAEIYTHDLCRAQLARGHEATVLCATANAQQAHGSLAWRVHDGVPVAELANHSVCETFDDTYRSRVVNDRLAAMLDEVKPDIVHIHNLLNLSFDLPQIARNAGARVVATLHDYSLVCPSGGQRVHRAESHVCYTIDPTRCARCFGQSDAGHRAALGHLKGSGSAPTALSSLARVARAALPLTVARISGRAPTLPVIEADIARRLMAAREVFDAVDLFVAPSPTLAREFVALGLPEQKLRIADYGCAPRRDQYPFHTKSARLRIGFIGTPAWHKGVHVLLDAVRMLPANAVDLTIVGDMNAYPDYAAELRKRAVGLRVSFTGRIAHADVERQYDRLDVLVIPSLWLENSPLVIHEAFRAGVPVVGSNIGGIPDLVRHEQNGLLFAVGDSHALAHELRRLLVDPDLLPRLADADNPSKSITDDAVEWDARYVALLGSAPRA